MHRLFLLGGMALLGFLISRLIRPRPHGPIARGPGSSGRQQIPPRGKTDATQPKRRPDDSRHGWDKVDEASYQSFPASDPPGYLPN